MLDSLLELVSASPWTYAFVLGIAALDAFFPIVPAETAVIAAGALTAAGDLELGAIIAVAAAGALIGDHISYAVGRTIGPRAQRRFFARGAARSRLDWARRQLVERGGSLLVVARFIPGGRTAATFTSGLVEMPWRRFVRFDLLAVVIWACFAAVLGHAGGAAFEDDPGIAIVLALVVSIGVGFAFELVRNRRRSVRTGDVPT